MDHSQNTAAAHMQISTALLGVPWQQPHHCSGLATLPSMGAIP